MHTDAHQYGEPLRSMRQEIAWHDKKEGQELLHLAQTSQRTDDPLDILVGDKQASGHVHYEVSDGNWYCDASPMSIPLYDGREARYDQSWFTNNGGRDEDEHIMATLAELGEIYEDDWDEEFEDEKRQVQACSPEGAKDENI